MSKGVRSRSLVPDPMGSRRPHWFQQENIRNRKEFMCGDLFLIVLFRGIIIIATMRDGYLTEPAEIEARRFLLQRSDDARVTSGAGPPPPVLYGICPSALRDEISALSSTGRTTRIPTRQLGTHTQGRRDPAVRGPGQKPPPNRIRILLFRSRRVGSMMIHEIGGRPCNVDGSYCGSMPPYSPPSCSHSSTWRRRAPNFPR